MGRPELHPAAVSAPGYYIAAKRHLWPWSQFSSWWGRRSIFMMYGGCLYCYIYIRTNSKKLHLFAYQDSTKFPEKSIRRYMDAPEDWISHLFWWLLLLKWGKGKKKPPPTTKNQTKNQTWKPAWSSFIKSCLFFQYCGKTTLTRKGTTSELMQNC